MIKTLYILKDKIAKRIFKTLFVVAFIVLGLLIGNIFLTVIPNLESKLMEEKKEFLYELTQTMEKILIDQIILDESEGKQYTKEHVSKFLSDFNYGKDKDDYFFLADENNKIIGHTNHQLIGTDITTLIDINGYKFGNEMWRITQNDGEGYVGYYWPSKSDPENIVPKLSYVVSLGDLDWILGTGIYIEDVQNEINELTRDIFTQLALNGIVVFLILMSVIYSGSKMEKDKQKMQNEFQSLLTNLPIGVFRLSKEEKSHPIMWNESLLKLFGLSATQLEDKNLLLTDYFKDTTQKNLFLSKIEGGHNLNRKEIEIINEKGEDLWINIGGNIVKEDKNIYFDGSAEDITESHKIHELLEKSYQQLQKSDGMKNDIIGITSHELRTPLTIIKGFASILKDDHLGPLNEKQGIYVDKIVDNTDKLLVMINNMLDLSKLEAGETIFVPEDILLRDMILQVYEDFLLQIKKEDKIINIHIPDEELIVEYDPIQLKRVFMNLVGNAIKFIPQHSGIIDIIVEKVSDTSINITIKDNGMGIKLTDQNDIFMKFKQVGGHMKRSSDGTGLGLPIVKTVLEQMKSKISLKSELGEGSEFSFQLKIK